MTYDVTMEDLAVFVVLGFSLGVFTSFYLTRLFELVHMHRIFREVIAHLLLMCTGIIEDIAFLKTLKHQQMLESGFTKEQIRSFEEVDDHTLTNWKLSQQGTTYIQEHAPFQYLGGRSVPSRI